MKDINKEFKDKLFVYLCCISVLLVTLLSFTMIAPAYIGNDGIFLINKLSDYEYAGFNLSDISFEPVVYQSQSLTDFFMPICIKKEDVQSIQDKDVDHTILNGNQNFTDRLRSIDFNIHESGTYWLVLYEMNVFASDKNFNIDFIPKIKGEELTHFSWFNSTFKYLSGSCVTNNVSDYSMLINISNVTGGDLVIGTNHQLNWSDIRFTGEDNSTELYHWIEYYEDNFAYFWINISDEDYINCYYGANISVGNSSYNSPDDTFFMWEDFDNITDWTHYTDFFVNGNGLCYVNSSSSYEYMYKDLGENDYLVKAKMISDVSSVSSAIQCVELSQNVKSSFSNWAVDNELGFQFVGNNPDGRTYSYKDTINLIVSAIGDGNWIKALYEYNGDMGVYHLNNYKYVEGEISGLDDYPRYLMVWTRAYSGSNIRIDYILVGIHNTPEPVFCEWSYSPYCSSLFSVSNESPVDDSIIASLNISYITIQANFIEGIGDSINISIVADNGLFYRNITNDVVNNSYSLNVIFANFSTETNYTYYVNFTGSGCVWGFDYTFTTTQYNLYEILQIIDYKIDVIDNKIIGVGDELDISIGLDGTLLTFALFGLFFVVGYTINKRSGGILMIFSGFTLIAFEFLVSSVLNAFLVIPLLSPIAILIIIVGVRKWLFPVEGEKTKSEGT